MRSAREDTIRGRVDVLVGRALEAFARMTGNRSAGAVGKAARTRGAARLGKARLKRRSEG